MLDPASNLALLLKKIKKAGIMQSADALFIGPAKLCLTYSIFLCYFASAPRTSEIDMGQQPVSALFRRTGKGNERLQINVLLAP
jgi:hypothetical protein